MTRVPISFYLNILAGSLVVFHHCASAETGDIALNKVTGATARFYALFEDAVVSHVQTALCSSVGQSAVDYLLPNESADVFKTRVCHQVTKHTTDPYDAESLAVPWDGNQARRGGYGGSEHPFVCLLPIRAPKSATSDPHSLAVEDILTKFTGRAVPLRPSVVNWKQLLDTLKSTWTIGAIALRVIGAVCYFRDPVKITGALFATHAALEVLARQFPASIVILNVIQVGVYIMDFRFWLTILTSECI